MKILKTNLSGFLHPNLLILLTWYLISILLILLSLVYSLCPNHAVALVLCLSALLMRIPLLFSLYILSIFSFNSSFYVPFTEFSFQIFRLLFHFCLLIFLLTQYRHNRKQNKIQNNTENENYTSRR